MLTNVIIIRFSLIDRNSWLNKLSYDEINHWLSFRISLFKKFTLPSIKSNNIDNYKIILLIENDHMFAFDFILGEENIVILKTNYENFIIDIIDYLTMNINGSVIVSRIDSDDYVSNNYFYNLNSSVEKNKFKECFYIVKSGCITDLNFMTLLDSYAPPFISVYSSDKKTAVKKLFSIPHTEVLDYDHAFVKESYWIQLVHGSNVANHLLKKSLISDLKYYVKYLRGIITLKKVSFVGYRIKFYGPLDKKLLPSLNNDEISSLLNLIKINNSRKKLA